MVEKKVKITVEIDSTKYSILKTRAENLEKTVEELVSELVDAYINIPVANIKRLLREALRSPSESKYLLELEKWERKISTYKDWKRFKVILGDVDDVIVKTEGKQVEKHVLIPKSVPVVVLEETYYSHLTSEPYVVLHIFTRNGWRKVFAK